MYRFLISPRTFMAPVLNRSTTSHSFSHSAMIPKPLNLLRYHRPKLRLNNAHIPPLTQQSKQFVIPHLPPLTIPSFRSNSLDVYGIWARTGVQRPVYPFRARDVQQCLLRCSSVVKGTCMSCSVGTFGVFVYSQKRNNKHMTFYRRSATLRSYAGDTSLPGGKVDPADRTFEDTAVCSNVLLFTGSFHLLIGF